ncbi:GTPase IMAP family member 9-like [Salminus brasiliensis]|uniref:GTPase IMAP family member 9-like n=1 Tax=Salminus brasiliensis TaxID=930266 RepID=UPI003B83593C
MASSIYPSRPRRRRSKILPPEMRIVPLGKNDQENRRVGNFILGRDAFDTEIPFRSERARGNVKGKSFSLVTTPHLFDTELSNEELDERVRECMSLCPPGPHVLALVLQRDDFTEADRKQLNFILRSLSEEACKYTIVLTQPGSSVDPGEENVSDEIIAEFSNWHFDFRSGSSPSAPVELMEKMVEENGGGHLKWKEFVMAPPATEQQKLRPPTAEREPEPTAQKVKMSQRLNLVLCGHDGAQKASISDLILGQSQRSPEPSLTCVRRTGVVSGRSVTLVEIPALCYTQEKESMLSSLSFLLAPSLMKTKKK